MKLSEQLERQRKRIGKTIPEVAAALQIPATTYRQWEKGYRTPMPFVAKCLKEKLKALK